MLFRPKHLITPVIMPELSVSDLIREKLKGVRIDFSEGVVDNGGVITYKEIRDLIGNDNWDGFLASVHSIKNNKHFIQMLKHLIDCQGNYCVRVASSEKEMDFGRATINGIELVKDLIEDLDKLYLEKGVKEPFDEHSVI
jgi:hypothetical protein